MSGDSATPLAKKLGIKVGHRVLMVDAPSGHESILAPLPEAARVMRSTDDEPYNVILVFTTEFTRLTELFRESAARLVPDGGLWICWPKQATKKPTDLDGNIIREYGLSTGLVDNKVCALDETWSALRFVIRLENRPRK